MKTILMAVLFIVLCCGTLLTAEADTVFIEDGDTVFVYPSKKEKKRARERGEKVVEHTTMVTNESGFIQYTDGSMESFWVFRDRSKER